LALQEDETRLTAEGVSAGTADHMSPEQTRGAALDARSDLFSLGVLLYESLTGVRPFARPTLEATFHAVRSEDPEPPTALRSGIPLELERIVMKLLRKDPAARYQTADDLATDLRALQSQVQADASQATTAGAVPTGATPPASPAPRPLRRRLLLVIPALLLLAAMAYILGGLRPHDGSVAIAAQRSIAVVSFQNVQDPSDPHREAVMAASLLTVGLGQSQVIPVVGAQRVHDVLKQMGKGDQAVSGADALLVGKRAGATYVVTGYVFQMQPSVVIGAEVANVADGAVLTSRRVAVPGGQQAMFAAIDSLTTALRDDLAKTGIGARPQPVDVAAQTTRSPVAYRAYAHGLDLLYRNDWTGARDALRSAVEADSTFALAWYSLAVATWWTADFPEASREVAAGLRLGSRLSERDHDGLRSLQSLIERRWSDAADRYRRLTERYPDDKEFWYGLGEALFHGGQDDDGANAALRRALRLDPQFGVALVHIVDIDVLREDLRAALADVDAFHRADPSNPLWLQSKMTIFGRLGYPDSALAYARLYSRAEPNFSTLRQIAVLLTASGQFDSARAVIPDARRAAGPVGAAVPMIANAYFALGEGRYHEAEQLSDRGMRALGPASLDPYANLLSFRATALLELGRRDEAAALILSSRTLPRHPDGTPQISHAEVIDVCVRAGHLREARADLEALRAELIQEPDPRKRRDGDYAAGLVALAEGRAKDAVDLFQGTRAKDGPGLLSPARRWGLARALLATGDHDGAMRELKKTIPRMAYGGDLIAMARAMLLLAKEYERAGRRDDALALYRRVAYQYRLAEPGMAENEEAKAGVARLETEKARASAS
ncbi:MAG: tetratricopeptide repeat protein, partial [Bacteroidota bacterium]